MSGGFTFSCSACGQSFDWTPQLANRKFGCSCGHSWVVPDVTFTPVAVVEQPDNDLIPLEGESAPGVLALDAAGHEVHPVEALPTRVLGYQNPGDDYRGHLHDPLRTRNRDKIVPMVVLVTCGLTLLVLCFVGSAPPGYVLRQILLRLGWEIGITFVVFVFLVSFFIDALVEKPMVAAIKLVAVATLRFTLWAIVGLHAQNLLADGGGFVLSFLPATVLLGYFFELDFNDTCFAAVWITLFRWLSYFGMWQLL